MRYAVGAIIVRKRPLDYVPSPLRNIMSGVRSVGKILDRNASAKTRNDHVEENNLRTIAECEPPGINIL